MVLNGFVVSGNVEGIVVLLIGLLGAEIPNFNTRMMLTASNVRKIKQTAKIRTQRWCHHLCGRVFPMIPSIYVWLLCIVCSARNYDTKKEQIIISNYFIYSCDYWLNDKRHVTLFLALMVVQQSYLCIINIICEHENEKIYFIACCSTWYVLILALYFYSTHITVQGSVNNHLFVVDIFHLSTSL